jgi:glutathione peroxidase
MNKSLLSLLGAVVVAGVSAMTCASPAANTTSMETTTATPAAVGTVYDFTVKSIDGKDVRLSQYKGKKLLIVNTASECGYTPQYKELEELYKKHGDKVTVLGFPANNFGGQEPGTEQQIATFCEKNYGVTFPLFSKVSVKGDDMAPLYKFLSDKSKNGRGRRSSQLEFLQVPGRRAGPRSEVLQVEGDAHERRAGRRYFEIKAVVSC